MQDIELSRATDISNGYSAGNYANAYETEDLETALAEIEDESADYRAAFVLGFFGCYELSEIPGSDRDAFDECYWSEVGSIVRDRGYCDSRDEDYRAECA